MKWIKLSERKPPQGGVYLACEGSENIAVCGYWPSFDNAWADHSTNRVVNVTHWMVLPQPPTEISEPAKLPTTTAGKNSAE